MALSLAPLAERNPLRIQGTAMPAGVLLMAKLVTLVFIVQGNIVRFPRPFLPLLPAFDQLHDSAAFKYALTALFAVAAVTLFCNIAVRASATLLGLVLFAAILSSRVYYENNKVYVAFILVLAGLTEAGKRPWALQAQVVLLYIAAGGNKALNRGWQTGDFMEEWSAYHAFGRVYEPIADMFPGQSLSMVLCWLAILGEFVIVALFLRRRTVPHAIWLGVAYHSALLLMTGRTFGLFWFAALASYLSFVDFPERGTHDRQDSRLWRALTNPAVYLGFAFLAALPQPEYRWIGVVAYAVLGAVALDHWRRRKQAKQSGAGAGAGATAGPAGPPPPRPAPSPSGAG